MTQGDEVRTPGLHLTIRLDHVRERYDPQRMRSTRQVETIVDASDQTFSPSVMGALLRALADEVNPRIGDLP